MGRVIAILSGKGGVGKTTITAELGIALAKRNQKVCVVDADVAMANLSLLLNMQGSPITLHDVLLGESSVQDAIYDGPMGLKLIPSGLSIENYRRVDPERLSSVIESISNQFDFILLDCPAGIEKSVMAAIAAADEVLLVTMPNSPSIADALKAKITAQRLNVKIIGVIVNFVRHEKGEIKFDDIQKILELPVFGLVPYDQEIRRSFMFEKISPLMVRNPGSPAALSIQKTAAKLAGLSVKIDEGEKRGILARIFGIFKKKSQ
ncbi:MAG: AAA family ATPase [Candidatus Diapherotrites archaeon]|nr:AAA family ATPase [Candidatus Diapherotrites archaeon]